MRIPVIAADVPEQSIRSVRLELDAYLFVDIRLEVVGRQILKVVLDKRSAVKHEPFAGARRQGRQHRRLTPHLASCWSLNVQRVDVIQVGDRTGGSVKPTVGSSSTPSAASTMTSG